MYMSQMCYINVHVCSYNTYIFIMCVCIYIYIYIYIYLYVCVSVCACACVAGRVQGYMRWGPRA